VASPLHGDPFTVLQVTSAVHEVRREAAARLDAQRAAWERGAAAALLDARAAASDAAREALRRIAARTLAQAGAMHAALATRLDAVACRAGGLESATETLRVCASQCA
jgi:hypothetical protein